MDTLSQEEIRYWTSQIRDTAAARVRWGGEDVIDSVTIDKVYSLLSNLKDIKVTVEMLKYSRVHKALAEIAKSGSGWSTALMWKAEMLLLVWEEALGPLKELRADLWCEGGRLEGLKRFDDLSEDVRRGVESEALLEAISGKGSGSKHYAPSWEIHYGEERIDAYFSGHNGFAPGRWWINTAAAHRDGIIHGLVHGITAGESIAYAIVMTDNEEKDPRDENHCYYQPPVTAPNRLKLIQNLTRKIPVRVLRTWHLRSAWKPQAGLRYDGLYKVKSFKVKLIAGRNDDEDIWTYSFDLQRTSSQLSMDEVMSHPTAAEMDDWKDFQKEKADLVRSRQPFGEVDVATFDLTKTQEPLREITFPIVRKNQGGGYVSRTESWLLS